MVPIRFSKFQKLFYMLVLMLVILIRHISASCASVEYLQDKIYEVIQMCQPAVVYIEIENGENGSGFLIKQEKSKGYILTNKHVVATKKGKVLDIVNIVFPDNRKFKGRVIKKSEELDLAIVKIEAKDLPEVLTIGNSHSAKQGEFIITLGNPMKYRRSASFGIISGTMRDARNNIYIQTDAAINPGNSGGPLVNLKGEVIGINTFKIIGEKVEGLGFALPINAAKTFIQNSGIDMEWKEGWIGEDFPDSRITKANRGIPVPTIMEGSSGYEAGLRSGDIILVYDNVTIDTLSQLKQLIRQSEQGRTVEIKILRDDKELNYSVLIQSLPYKKKCDKTYFGTGKFGFYVNEGFSGIKISHIEIGGTAWCSGLKTNDILISINGQKVVSISKYKEIRDSLNKGETVEIIVNHDGEEKNYIVDIVK